MLFLRISQIYDVKGCPLHSNQVTLEKGYVHVAMAYCGGYAYMEDLDFYVLNIFHKEEEE